MSFFFKDPITFSKRPEGTDEFSRKLVAYDSSGFGWVITPDLSGTNFTLQPNPTFYRDFATYKTLNHGEGPNINFTRGTSATYFDQSGVLRMAGINEPRFDHSNFRTNLATWSVFTSSGNSRWTNVFPSFATILTGIDAPDGSTTAVRLSCNNQGAALFRVNINSFTVSVSGTPYTLSFWCRRVSGSGGAAMDFTDGAPNGNYDSQLVTGEWRRVSLSGIPLSGTKTFIDVYSNLTSNLVLDYWGLQLETGLSATAYIPVSGSAVTVGESRGLLIEEGRTNLLQRSAEFDNAYWSKTNSSVIANSTTAPDGTTTADTLVEDTSNGVHDFRRPAAPASENTTYTASVFVKALTRVRGELQIYGNSGGSTVTFNLSSQTATATGSYGGWSNASATITNVGNGWFRVTNTATTNTGATGITISIAAADNSGNGSYTGDGTSGLFIWGAQLEEGAFATSYIPTTDNTASRAAGSIIVNPINSFYNQSEGTLFAEALSPNAAAFFIAQTFSDETINNELRQGSQSNGANPSFVVNNSGALQASVGVNLSVNTAYRICSTYSQNNFNSATNGTLGTPDTLGSVPSVSRLTIGARGTNTLHLNGHIRKIAYWPKRLPNTFLQQQTQ